jgi:hypothetical protein
MKAFFSSNTRLTPLAMRYFLLLLPLAFLALPYGCGSKSDDHTQDSLKLVSDEFLTDSTPTQGTSAFESKPAKVQPKAKARTYSCNGGSNSSGDPSSYTPTAAPEPRYQAAARQGDSPQDFANAIILPVIRLCFLDPVSDASAKVLSETDQGKHWEMKVEILWKDKWSKFPYVVTGKLKVNKDGTQAQFDIEEKNDAAEALEVTTGRQQTQLKLAKI